MPAREGSFEVSSRLGAPAAEVWAFATTAVGLVPLLRPVFRLTFRHRHRRLRRRFGAG